MAHDCPESLFKLLLREARNQKLRPVKQLHVIGAHFWGVKLHPHVVKRRVESPRASGGISLTKINDTNSSKEILVRSLGSRSSMEKV